MRLLLYGLLFICKPLQFKNCIKETAKEFLKNKTEYFIFIFSHVLLVETQSINSSVPMCACACEGVCCVCMCVQVSG